MGITRVTQVEDTVGVKVLGQEPGMFEGMLGGQGEWSKICKNSRDMSSKMEVGMGSQMALSLCELLKALAFTLTWEP